MATRRSWLATTVFLVIAIHLSLPEAQGCCDKKKHKKSGQDCCDPCFPWNPYLGFPPYGGVNGRWGPWNNGYCGNYLNDCCDGWGPYNCNYYGGKKGRKKGGKKESKLWKKLFKKRGKGNKKNKDKGQYGCCGGQTVIVRNGPAIIQTVIVDKDVYAKYCNGCYKNNNPLQKVCIQDDGKYCRTHPRFPCFDEFDPHRLGGPDPYCRNYIGDPCNYPYY